MSPFCRFIGYRTWFGSVGERSLFAEITWLIAWMTSEFGVVIGVLPSRRFFQIG
jgi:hypothetical protein